MLGSDPMGKSMVWKTWQSAQCLQADWEEQSLFCCHVKYKTLKNNTTCGTDPSQLQGCWRLSEMQKSVLGMEGQEQGS